MKSEILEALTDPSIVKIKHVKKSVFKKLGSEDVEDFDKAIKSLTKKNKIEVVGDKVRLLSSNEETSKKANESESNSGNSKRKRSEEVTSNSTENDKTNRKTKKEKSTGHTDTYELWKNGEAAWRNNTLEPTYLTQNPDKITRLFCGNLKKEITEEQLKEALPGVTFIKWIRDKESGEFYGTTFLEMNDSKSAASAMMKDRSKFMGRPLKIYYCPPKPGDVWPPLNATSTKPVGFAQSNGSNNPAALREKTPKPTNCCKLFMGNLSCMYISTH